ncbi:MAG: thrombospondin type 3 repeat-containing protein, partial [Thermoplasmata archaeon]
MSMIRRNVWAIILGATLVLSAMVLFVPEPAKAQPLNSVALFQNNDPWGTTSNKDILTSNGISYDVFTSADMGVVDLSGYDKIIVSSQQTNSFYQDLAANRAWFESYIAIGKKFEMHGATYFSDSWDGLIMPGGFSSVDSMMIDQLTISDPGHEVVNNPHVITDSEIDNWLYSSHGHLTGFSVSPKVIIEDTLTGDPVLAEFRFGGGTVIASMMTLEWAYFWGYSPLLENLILYNPISVDHDIAVAPLDVPDIVERTGTYFVNTTIWNLGLNDETSIIVNFSMDGIVQDSRFIPSLPKESSQDVSFLWNPMVSRDYFLEVEASFVPDENITTNNAANKTVTVVDTTPPATPQGFRIKLIPTGNALNITWQENTEPDLAYYNIYASMDAEGYTLIAQVPAGADHWIDTSVSNGLTYYYKMSAEDSVPNESPTTMVRAAIPDYDSDNDGTGDAFDNDDDNDGVPDNVDAFPFDPTEWSDFDGDGIGDNADPDDDNDGVPDGSDQFPYNGNEYIDSDGDGIGDNTDRDDDNDGVPDDMDAFPYDPFEWEDTDGDGIGNNLDPDDDGDTVPDGIDDFPLNPDEWTDTDGDGIGDNADPDDDNDGRPDETDAFPLDLTEWEDTDGDGVGNNADTDDDNDGVLDASDDFPLNPNEYRDTDNDGIGDNLDTDDDNDGVTDDLDAFPLNPTESLDTDGDGLGNNADPDDDGDGVIDIE